jgi:hypothetical protein
MGWVKIALKDWIGRACLINAGLCFLAIAMEWRSTWENVGVFIVSAIIISLLIERMNYDKTD